MTHIWIVVLMFSLPHSTEAGTIFCKNLACVNKLVALERRNPNVTGIEVYQRGDADTYFSHMFPFKLNERKA